MNITQIICANCKCLFGKETRKYKYELKTGTKKFYCSKECFAARKSLASKVNCKECGKESVKSANDIKRFGQGFCSRSCRAVYYNKNKYISNIIKQKGPLNVACNKCQANIQVNSRSSKKSRICDNCKLQSANNNISAITGKVLTKYAVVNSKCIICELELCGRGNAKKFCDKCRKENSRAIGARSAASQAETRRSKNEKLFGELLSKKYPNSQLLFNELFFKDKNGDGWDADIIFPEFKIAIHWNGAWHYKKCAKKHSVAQVQNRDNLKYKIIEDNGYTNYIIKDMGKFNPQKVEEEIALFKEYLLTISN